MNDENDQKVEVSPEVKLVDAALKSKENSDEIPGCCSFGVTDLYSAFDKIPVSSSMVGEFKEIEVPTNSSLNMIPLYSAAPLLTPMKDEGSIDNDKGLISRIMRNIRSFFTGW